jgi:hypothetical protein
MPDPRSEQSKPEPFRPHAPSLPKAAGAIRAFAKHFTSNEQKDNTMSKPYVYHYLGAFSRSHKLSQAIARKELHKAGFEIASKPAAWEHFAVNADMIAVVTNVPLSASKTYVHVLATSNAGAPAKKWAIAIMKAIKESRMVLID